MERQRVSDLIEIVRAMVDSRADLWALAVCGSWARGDARPDSDLDLVIVADEPAIWRRDQDWIETLAYGEAGCAYRGHRFEHYGAVWSAHVDLYPYAELELTFAALSWADVEPVDPGTRAVVAGGFKVVVDKAGLLSRLARECGTPVRAD